MLFGTLRAVKVIYLAQLNSVVSHFGRKTWFFRSGKSREILSRSDIWSTGSPQAAAGCETQPNDIMTYHDISWHHRTLCPAYTLLLCDLDDVAGLLLWHALVTKMDKQHLKVPKLSESPTRKTCRQVTSIIQYLPVSSSITFHSTTRLNPQVPWTAQGQLAKQPLQWWQ